MDEPQGSRLFVVCGKAAEVNDLEVAFKQYGNVQYVKMVRDKGVAYVKFDKASTAAKAMEELNGIVLNDGRGPQLKVLQAESPNNRGSPRQPTLDELYQDPVNHPPRSRLFLVVPRTADEQVLQEEMSKYEGMEYCKTDLISTKGIAFAKYSKASQALAAMEDINKTNMLANYRIKCMLAEPKLRRGAQPRADLGALGLPADSLFLQGMDPSGATIGGLDQLLQQGSLEGLAPPGTPTLTSFSGLGGMDHVDWMSQLNGLNVNTLVDIPQQTLDPFGNVNNLAGQLNSLGLNNTVQGQVTPPISPMTPMARLPPAAVLESPMSMPNSQAKQRLFVVVHKGVNEEQLARCFRRFPGMEYCDLKRDRIYGRSKGYAYVNYSTPEAAQAAIEHLNGIEFPQGTGQQLKVMLADPLMPRNDGRQGEVMNESANVELGAMDNSDIYYSDPRVVHFELERPLPDYALKTVFHEHCHVESVQLRRDDPRQGIAVTLSAEDAQRLAITLHGQNIVGVPIQMFLYSVVDPNTMMQADHAAAQPMGPGMLASHMDFSGHMLPEGHIN